MCTELDNINVLLIRIAHSLSPLQIEGIRHVC